MSARDWRRLSPSARWLFYLQAVSRLALFWVPLTMFSLVAGPFVVPWTYLFGGLAALWLWLIVSSVWFPWLEFERWAYALRSDDLVIARGVLVRAVTAVPLARIQHVDTRQGPLEQLFGLARVQIHTASGVGADGVIPGLPKEVAEQLRDELIRVSGDGGV